MATAGLGTMRNVAKQCAQSADRHESGRSAAGVWRIASLAPQAW